MAKVRVYELAKELDTDSKELVEKLIAGGMSIKNYMSTLDEIAVTKARDIFSGAISEVVEEKRIKPTVIRRRKKTVRVAPETPKPKPEEEEALEEPEILPEEEIKEEMAASVEEVKEMEPEEIEEPPAKAKSKAKVKKSKKKKPEAPAKIIKGPEEGPLKVVVERKKEKRAAAKKPEKSATSPVDVPLTPEEEERKGKPSRKKKENKKAQKTEDLPKGAVRRKKLEIIERAALGLDRRRKRKRKDARLGKDVRKNIKQTEITTPKAIKRRLRVQEKITISELAKAMGVKGVDLVKKLMALGVPTSINKSVDFETASLVAEEFGFELELDQFEAETILAEEEDKAEDLKPRPPVVTIMGHVDHGKTSLLDYIRESNIIAGESGGITQHIGAYYVEKEGGDVVFLDTPGHEAFTAMRARGAQITDIVIIVVAADDGVMPQTREAIDHARAAEIPIIVAINKIDKPDADIERVKRELAELELAPEDWGGDTISGLISAKTGEGINELLELVLLQAEMLELKANPNKPARGTIIEAELDKSKGAVANVLIKSGTLRQGDYFICGQEYGRVRAMLNNRGKRMISAEPSTPVEIYGISGVPMAGNEFVVVKDEKMAKQVMGHRQDQMRSMEASHRGIVSLDDLFEKIKEGEIKELNIILKADVQGSIEAVSDSFAKLNTDEVKLKTIHASTGGITETDVNLASASGAIIIGFRVRANPRVTAIAEKERVDIRYYDVIYNAIKEIRLAMTGLLDPVYKEKVIGRADIKEVFHAPKIGAVAGCQVTDGHIERNARARLLRDEVVVFEGKLASLRRFKDDVKEVQAGYECGIGLENFQDIKPGDVFEVYVMEEVAAEL
jgi:translation initiation factor IF-2